MSEPYKIYLDMIGCRLNQSELERIGGHARQAGHVLVAESSDADVAIINTCGVTSKAASDSRQLARRIHKAGVNQIILTGCWASLEPERAASIPGVTQVIPNDKKDWLVPLALPPDEEKFELEPMQRQPLPGVRKRTRAFIKVQDGCDQHCTFCVTTIARGRSVSVPVADVVQQVQAAAAGGAKEIILTGVQLGSWGVDLDPKLRIDQLLQTILDHTDIPRIRLSSIEPWSITPSVLALWENHRLCRQLHLPLQSGSAKTLKRMARGFNPSRYRTLLGEIRETIPDIAITTDVIVGFPGESDFDFEESLEFVRSMGFADGHVFTYSERPGTAAAAYPGPVQESIRRHRNQRMQLVLTESSTTFHSQFIGKHLSVLWESLLSLDSQGWTLRGNSSQGFGIHALGARELQNQISTVLLTQKSDNGVLLGEILPAPFTA